MNKVTGIIALSLISIAGWVSAKEIPTAIELTDIYKENQLISRIPVNSVMQFYQSCEAKQLDCSAALVDENGLTAKGQQIFEILSKSDEIGLNPSFYNVSLLQAKFAVKDTVDNLDEIEAILVNGALTYIRDASTGMPELKKTDDNWMLAGRIVDPAISFVDILLQDDISKGFGGIEPNYKAYRDLKIAYHKLLGQEREEKPFTNVPTGQTLRKGMEGSTIYSLRQRLIESGHLVKIDEMDYIFDESLEEAVKKFQDENQLQADGVVGGQTISKMNASKESQLDQVRINLERWRWMPEELENHHLIVEIPKFEYFIEKDGKEIIRAKTVVGMKARKTPVFKSTMSYLVFSPYWNVPRSMAVNDQLPKLKQDPYRLARSGIRIFTNGGQEVDPGMVDWNRYNRNNFPFNLRQDPGPYNSLGRVKFMFPNQHAIYLHDTPQRYLFDSEYRARSSGCVRVENPTELAVYLLKDLGWTENRVKQSYGQKKESTVSVSKDMKFPVYTLYFTAEVKDDTLIFYSDIYEKDNLAVNALHLLEKKYIYNK